MSVKDLINKAYEKDAAGFEEMFASIMSDRVETAIGAKYDSMFGEGKKYHKEDEDEHDDYKDDEKKKKDHDDDDEDDD